MQTRKIFKQNKYKTAYDFARQVQRLREDKGLTIEELAVQAHIALPALRRMEMGYFEDWGALYNLTKFFDRKIRIEFY